MAAGLLEDSLSSPLEYDAEVAYITATSPQEAGQLSKLKSASKSSLAEFEFSANQHPVDNKDATRVDAAPKGEVSLGGTPGKEEVSLGGTPGKGKKKKEVNLTLMNDPKLLQTSDFGRSSLSPPASAHAAHYALDMDETLPGTPKSRLRQIKEAQASPLVSAKPKFKFGESHYKTLVVYGTTGCGRTHLAQKLVHSNPAVFAKVVSSTTRKRRPSELDGVDFHYLTHEEMSSGIVRGDFIEYIQVRRHKQKEKRRKLTVHHKGGSPPPIGQRQMPEQRSATLTQLPIPQGNNSPVLVAGHRFESVFDLTEEDSPVLGGEVFGTTHQSLAAAGQQGKPCVVINVSTKGALQLKQANVKASYVLVQNSQSRQDTLGVAEGLKPDYTISSDNMEQAYSQVHQYAFQLIQDLNLAQSTKLEIARHEWDSLPTVEFDSKDAVLQRPLRPVNFSEILSYIQNCNLKKEKTAAKADLPRSGFFSRSKLAKKLHQERLLVTAIAKQHFNDKDRLHLRTLQTIYSKLTGSNLNCRRFGTHWQDIGFNSIDPADDLQGVGFLGLAQLIYFLDNPLTSALALEIYRYSRDEMHLVPFCVLSINFTQLALSALREGCLNKICNKRDQVFVVVNEFYMATFNRYYQRWHRFRKTILELGPLLQDVSEQGKSNPKELLDDIRDYTEGKDTGSSKSEALSHPTQENPFTPMDKMIDDII